MWKTTIGVPAMAFASLLPAVAQAQGRPTALAATRASTSELRAVDQQIDQFVRSGDLRVREEMRDPLLPDRRHERFDQYHHGVRIVGGDLTRQLAPDGTVSVFGMFHQGLELDTTPRLSVSEARITIAAAAGGEPGGDPELVVLPQPDGYHLAPAWAWPPVFRTQASSWPSEGGATLEVDAGGAHVAGGIRLRF